MGRTLVDSLRDIQRQEAASHRSYMDPGAAGGADAAECRDLQQRYVYQSHYLAVWLLHLVGFRCLTDPALIHEGELDHRLHRGRPALVENLEAISYEFQLSRANPRTLWAAGGKMLVQRGLGVVNPVLRAMYGREVRRAPARAGGNHFTLECTKLGKLFAFGPDPVFGGSPPGDRPNIPCQLEGLGADADGLSLLALLLDEYFWERGDEGMEG